MLPDVNVLVNAFRADTRDHVVCRNWLQKVIGGVSHYGIAPQVLSAVIRVATHPKVFVRPNGLHETMEFCNFLLDQPHCVLIQPGEQHWSIFCRLCKEAEARGNLVPDAWFAALAVEFGCELITLDRDYARFPGLRWRLPE